MWLNLDPASYYDAVEWRLADLALPGWIAPDRILVTPQTLVANVAMALFLAFIAKELWEALVLRRGALTGRQSIMPFAMTVGAMFGATVMWLGRMIARCWSRMKFAAAFCVPAALPQR